MSDRDIIEDALRLVVTSFNSADEFRRRSEIQTAALSALARLEPNHTPEQPSEQGKKSYAPDWKPISGSKEGKKSWGKKK